MEASKLSSLSNPLATADQLTHSASQLDGVSLELERTLRYDGCLLTQAAGILLRLNQDVIAQAIVTFSRFYVGSEGGSFRENGIKDISAAALYLTAKLSSEPQTTRSILNAYAYLESPISQFSTRDASPPSKQPDPSSYTLSEGTYMSQRLQLMANESLILRQLSYVTRVVLPHPLALTYIQTLFPPGSAIGHARKRRLAERVIALLNSALLSPQLLYLTHQPHALAVAAIYLAARETGLRIADNEWWLVWDVTREELGFLVLAFRSVEAWVGAEHAQQKQRLWTVSDVEKELERLQEHGGK